MTTLIQVITEAFRMFFEIIPRVTKVCADERGIKFCLWSKVKVLEPGVYLYIPLFHKVEIKTVSTRSVNLKRQSLITKDKVEILVESSCFFEIVDIKKALVDNHDIRDIIEDLVLSNIKSCILENDLDYILFNQKEIEEGILKKAGEYEEKTGVKLGSIRITDVAPCVHLNNIKNITYRKVALD